MTGITMILVLALASALAFWRPNAVLFMITAGIAVMTGLYAPDLISGVTMTPIGLSIGLLIIAYAFLCLAFAYITLFRMGKGYDNGST